MMAFQPYQLLGFCHISMFRYIVDSMAPVLGARAHTVLVSSPCKSTYKVGLAVAGVAWACLVL